MAMRTSPVWIILLFFIATSSSGYIPDVKDIFGDLTRNNRSVQSYKIKQQRTLFDPKFENGQLEVNEEIFLKPPWQYAKVSRYQDKSQTIIYDGFRYLRLVGNKWLVPKEKFELPLIYGFYLGFNKDELTSFLMKKKINPVHPVLSRREEVVTILFSSTDKNQAKLWLDKEVFWPLAYFHKESGSSNPGSLDVETVFLNYQKIVTAVYFPMKIERYTGGVVTERVKVIEVNPEVKISPTLFDISYIKNKYPKYKETDVSDYVDLESGIQ